MQLKKKAQKYNCTIVLHSHAPRGREGGREGGRYGEVHRISLLNVSISWMLLDNLEENKTTPVTYIGYMTRSTQEKYRPPPLPPPNPPL